MKILVFGASQGIGFQVVKKALEEGHGVTGITRNPDQFTLKHEHLRIIKGDVLNLSTIKAGFEGHDAVVSVLGPKGSGNFKPTVLFSKGVENIIRAMQDSDVDRLICISALGLEVTPGMSLPLKIITKRVLQPLLKYSFSDLRKMESIVTGSNLQWTIVRPPSLNNGRRTGKYRMAIGEYIDNPGKISRADVADFIVHHLSDQETYRERVEISY